MENKCLEIKIVEQYLYLDRNRDMHNFEASTKIVSQEKANSIAGPVEFPPNFAPNTPRQFDERPYKIQESPCWDGTVSLSNSCPKPQIKRKKRKESITVIYQTWKQSATMLKKYHAHSRQQFWPSIKSFDVGLKTNGWVSIIFLQDHAHYLSRMLLICVKNSCETRLTLTNSSQARKIW